MWLFKIRSLGTDVKKYKTWGKYKRIVILSGKI
jgi:hypothetical protein